MLRRATRTKRAAVGLAAVAVTLGTFYGVGGAKNTPTPAVPTAPTAAPAITTGPADGGAVASASAAFAFTHSQAGVDFQCSLDDGGFAGCTSPKSYGGLADGAHTFRVAAKNGGSALGPAASRSWTVDTTAPALTLGFPADKTPATASAWGTGCAGGAGICGTAGDARGVTAVGVSVQQSFGAKRFWNGTSFGGASQVFVNAILSSPNAASPTWRLPLALPADGDYKLQLSAVDGLGNQTKSGYVSAGFTIDATPPPAPVLTATPTDPTFDTRAHFDYSDTEAGVSFRCSLDGAAFVACGGSSNYDGLALGDHRFQVVAVDKAGNSSAAVPSPPFAWTILTKSSFQLAGSIGSLFYPGVAQRLDLQIGNPYDFALQVLSVAITAAPDAAHTACTAPANFRLDNPDSPGGNEITFATPVVVPKSSTRTLSQLGVPQQYWPKLLMPALPSNQDACKGATFTLNYSGKATKS
jgi:hypothetical protein